ncbi:MAG TPA: phosphoenolpyruvate carboxykinase (ATP), partial [Gemmatimonadales bacterium]|nr:phosphoenolpyruvate carboxykinase (ATP) [Gemmatimonadales bacterium]
TTTDPIFGLAVPKLVHGVPAEVMNPRGTWSDPAAYDAQARKLAGMFAKNFEQFASAVSDGVKRAGPKGT